MIMFNSFFFISILKTDLFLFVMLVRPQFRIEEAIASALEINSFRSMEPVVLNSRFSQIGSTTLTKVALLIVCAQTFAVSF